MTRSAGPTPFFAAPAREPAAAGRARLLLISYVFPPDQTIGALRWRRMLPLLAEHGWDADVITCHPAGSAGGSCPGLRELPPGTRVFGVPPWDPVTRGVERTLDRARRAIFRRDQPTSPALTTTDAMHFSDGRPHRPATIDVTEVRWRATSPRGWVRAYFAWAEYASSIGWARAASDLGVRLCRDTQYHVVATSAPPHMTHDAGRRIANRTGLPFVMDMRDPWSLSERLFEFVASPLWLRLARHYEARAVDQASLVVTTTEPLRSAMAAEYAAAADRLITVANGVDTEPLPPSPANPMPDGRFTIRYAGTIYGERHPEALFRAVAKVVRTLSLSPSEFAVEFIGVDPVVRSALLARAAAAGVADFVTIGDRRPRAEALSFLAEATMLVTFPTPNEILAVPAKLFECVRFPAWLLVLAPPEAAAAALLAGTAAAVASPSDLDAIAHAITERVIDARRGVSRPAPLEGLARLTRRSQAAILVRALNGIQAAPPRLGRRA